ncbi:MAG: hypothetical protein LBI27_00995, partial [Clostridiales bacterium]|nr:hypothetical protein [Clostridiales bacterium]
TKQERITSLEEQIAELEKQKKKLVQKYKEERVPIAIYHLSMKIFSRGKGNRDKFTYSYLKASMGSSLAAFLAG